MLPANAGEALGRDDHRIARRKDAAHARPFIVGTGLADEYRAADALRRTRHALSAMQVLSQDVRHPGDHRRGVPANEAEVAHRAPILAKVRLVVAAIPGGDGKRRPAEHRARAAGPALGAGHHALALELAHGRAIMRAVRAGQRVHDSHLHRLGHAKHLSSLTGRARTKRGRAERATSYAVAACGLLPS